VWVWVWVCVDTCQARVSTANSIYSSAVYVGGALASLTILLDNQIGWRDSSILIGFFIKFFFRFFFLKTQESFYKKITHAYTHS
jgi:hypothetical protein